MLNIFPDLLYPFLAPTLLRIGVAIAFVAIAVMQWRRREEISRTDFIYVGPNTWWVWLSIAVHVVVAIMLFVGTYTQAAALVGALITCKAFVWGKKYPGAFPLSRGASLLLLLICLSLVVSGAGGFARDLPF